MNVKYSKEKRGDVLVFQILQKELNYNHASSFKEQLFLDIADGNSLIVLNMENVNHIDSSGLGAILFGTRQANNSGGKLVLTGVNPNIDTLLKIARLDRIYEIFPNVDEAVNSFGSAKK